MMKRIILYGIVLAFTIQVNAKTSFRTERLKTIAGMVKLNVPDSLEKHLTIDSLGRYKNKPVKLKTNSFGDVSHIGYKLFNGRTDGTHDPMMPFLISSSAISWSSIWNSTERSLRNGYFWIR